MLIFRCLRAVIEQCHQTFGAWGDAAITSVLGRWPDLQWGCCTCRKTKVLMTHRARGVKAKLAGEIGLLDMVLNSCTNFFIYIICTLLFCIRSFISALCGRYMDKCKNLCNFSIVTVLLLWRQYSIVLGNSVCPAFALSRFRHKKRKCWPLEGVYQ